MKNRIVEITTDGAYLHIERGFVCVDLKGEKLGKIAVDDMAALIIRGYGVSLSANVCSRLSCHNVPVVLCHSTQSPLCRYLAYWRAFCPRATYASTGPSQ